MEKNYFNLNRKIFATLFVLSSVCSLGQVIQTFSYTGAIQPFVVPPCVTTMTIEANGAQGGGGGGLGARMTGVFAVIPGQTINVLVGGAGGLSQNQVGNGGGGGSFVVLSNNTPLCIAGGGGGTAHNNSNGNYVLIGGQTSTAGQVGQYQGAGNGGTNGSGGFESYTTGSPSVPNGGGGGGLLTNGGSSGNAFGGAAYINGGAGGNSTGGFGGGGGSNLFIYGCGLSPHGGSGGGGYSGGGAGGSNCNGAGGGGGSFNSGSNQVNSAAVNSGDGSVKFSYFFAGNLTSATASPTLICSGSTTTLNSGGGQVSYTWSPGGSTSPSIVVSPNVNTTYTVQGTNAQGCVSSATLTVMVNQAVPTLTVVNSASVVCAGKSSTLTASGALTYTWTGGVSPTNGIGFIPNATTDYTITGGNACGTSTAVTTITVNPLPNIGGAVNTPTVCFGTQVTLNGTGSAGGYTWTNGASNNTPFTPPVGTNTYIVTGSGANSCTNTAVVTVTVFQTPTITPVVTPTAICVGKSATLSATGAANGYTWSTNPAVFTSTAVVSPVITTTYSVIRASSSCTSIATVTVVVNPLPNLLVGAPNPPTICAGTCATVTGQGAITYTWFPGGFQGGVITVCPNFSTNYTVVASNANCTTSATSSVTVLPNPVLSIQASTTTPCAGSQITMTVTGASTYTWASPITVPQQNLNTVTDNPFAPVQYNVSGTDANGCTSITNLVILPQAAPNLTTYIVNTGSYICAGQTGTLVAQGTGQINYNWLPNGASTAINTVNPPVSTVYTVTGTNPNTGCMSMATLSLAVYISTFVASSPTAICKGNTATLSVAGAANNYTWSAGSPNNNDSIFVSPQSNITYYVTGITGNCSTTQSINLIVNPIPPVSGVAQKITICRFEPGVLIGSGAGANGTYSWTGGAGAITPNYTVFPTITTTYTLTGTDVNGCTKTVPVTQLVATCIGIEEQSNLAGMLSIYPNPSKGEFTIQAGTSMNITIMNELGQLVSTFTAGEKENTVNVKGLANGIYFIRAEKDGNIMTTRMVVDKN